MVRSRLAPAAAFLTLVSCTSPDSAADDTEISSEAESETGGPAWTAPTSPWISSDGERLRDASGRVRIFRGVNARVEGVFDVSFDDGRERLEQIPEFTAQDARRMRELGFNLLRLPINWSGIEPERDAFDEAYLDRVAAVVELCKAEGIWVMIDVHQDAYSKEIGEDGAPYWAIVPEPPPEAVHEGPLTAEELEDARTSLPVLLAFLSFFADDDEDPIDQELQGEFAEMAAHVAARFAEEPWVIGYELFNEPVAEDRYLLPFHTRVAEAIRAVDARHLLFFEPNAIRNFKDEAPLASQPFPDPGGVYAPHMYTLIFSDPDDELPTLEKARLEPNFDNAVREAQSWRTPLFVGEWGIGPDGPSSANYVRWMYELFDTHQLHAAMWLWKENSQGSWGFYDWDEASETWTERPQMVAWHSRAFVHAVGGEPEHMHYDPDAPRFELRYTTEFEDAETLIYVPEPERFGGEAVVRCDGETVEASPDDFGRLAIVCPGDGAHELVVVPAG